MPDLGPYAWAVLAAYGVTFVLLAVLVGVSLARARRVKAELQAQEAEDG